MATPTRNVQARKKTGNEDGRSFEMEVGMKMRRFYRVIDKIKIDEGTLDGLKSEFDHVKEKANTFWNKFYTNKLDN